VSIIVVFEKEKDREAIASLLEKNGLPVRCACRSGQEAIRTAKHLDGAVVICGYKFPDMTAERMSHQLSGSGAAVLEALTVEQIQALAGQWAAFSKEADPGLESGKEWVDALKKAWSTRRRSGCGGVCCEPSGPCRLRNGWEGCASGTTSGAR